MRIRQLCWVLVLLVAGCGRPPSLIRAYMGGGEAVLYYYPTEEKRVALTIDDVPAESTDTILDVLRAHGARATLFVIGGQVAGREALLRRARAEGHELGNHTWTKRPSYRLSAEQFRAEFLRTDSLLRQLGEAPRWLRPGSGRVLHPMLEVAHAHGYRVLLGDVYPMDPQIPSAGFAADHILGTVRPGSVIILHDGDRRGRRAARALDAVLPVLAAAGYSVVTASELFGRGGVRPR